MTDVLNSLGIEYLAASASSLASAGLRSSIAARAASPGLRVREDQKQSARVERRRAVAVTIRTPPPQRANGFEVGDSFV